MVSFFSFFEIMNVIILVIGGLATGLRLQFWQCHFGLWFVFSSSYSAYGMNLTAVRLPWLMLVKMYSCLFHQIQVTLSLVRVDAVGFRKNPLGCISLRFWFQSFFFLKKKHQVP
uniref:Uncharacterized protein n=1 Tax=Opuntia streptacantha TaxID=393608 RepID=A0A7C9DKU1_OPUST